MTITTGTTLDHALAYAAKGWPVFPIKPQSKWPATDNGFYDATTNPATIERWFGTGFPYNIAIRTGEPSGVFVLDVDGDTGTASHDKFTIECGLLPQTLTSLTGKGRHFWFRTDGQPVPCSIGKIAPGIDIRGDLGYVVAPPSIHPSGARYRWINETATPAIAPAWLIELTRKKPPPVEVPISARARALIRRTHNGGSGAYGATALEEEIEILANAPRGRRNDQLNRSTFALFQLVGGGELDEPDVLPLILQAAHINGLVADDGLASVLKTIASARAAGLANPRSRPGAA